MDFNDEEQETYQTFSRLTNMPPQELEDWLESGESKSVGWTRAGESESVGRQSGKRILAIKRTKKADLSADDLKHMRKVISYIKRHRVQEPLRTDLATTRWRYSLMNWGHDPCKDPDVDC